MRLPDPAHEPAPGPSGPEEPGTRGRAPVPPWIPNLLSFARIALTPVFLFLAWAVLHPPGGGPSGAVWRGAAFSVLAVIGASDWLDGHLARKWGLSTRFGALLDAAADRLAQLSALALFAFSGGAAFARVPVWFLAVVVGRDLVIGGGALARRTAGASLRGTHRLHGRLATFLLFLLLLWITAGLPVPGGPLLFYGLSALVIGSAGWYLAEDLTTLRGRG